MKAFETLKVFLARTMRMSHIYQPVMVKALLLGKGKATARQIARAFLVRDESQLEYYEQITHNMVGRVLRRHGIVERQGENYSLVGYEELKPDDVELLKSLCDQRTDDYVTRRGRGIWRGAIGGYISGTVQYEVLKRARFRCELCGISAEEKALQVDHIEPKSRGGPDQIDNLQALCYSCNAMKRDRDATDFRPWRVEYDRREPSCLFCGMPTGRVISENALAYAVRDGFPVTDLHTLIIPKRHVPDYFGLSRPEMNACHRLLDELKVDIESRDRSVAGFNIGMNAGAVAGQTVFHCHIHLIPRRAGDVSEPRGGVRHVIPGKGDYRA